MAKHRRVASRPVARSRLSEHDLSAISAELQQRSPTTPVTQIDSAIRATVDALSGLDTAPHHLHAIVRRGAEVALSDAASPDGRRIGQGRR
ncbi:MAG TPA: hypothetical protein VFW65_36940 [Pseudonocardiaceae bacterium]|nr:hypothetical protein [Pseudonocardiaceae bacterium]